MVVVEVRDDQTRLCQLPVIGKIKLDQIVRAGHFPPRLDAPQAERVKYAMVCKRKEASFPSWCVECLLLLFLGLMEVA